MSEESVEQKELEGVGAKSSASVVPFHKKVIVGTAALLLLSIMFPPDYRSLSGGRKDFTEFKFILGEYLDIYWEILALEWLAIGILAAIILYMAKSRTTDQS